MPLDAARRELHSKPGLGGSILLVQAVGATPRGRVECNCSRCLFATPRRISKQCHSESPQIVDLLSLSDPFLPDSARVCVSQCLLVYCTALTNSRRGLHVDSGLSTKRSSISRSSKAPRCSFPSYNPLTCNLLLLILRGGHALCPGFCSAGLSTGWYQCSNECGDMAGEKTRCQEGNSAVLWSLVGRFLEFGGLSLENCLGVLRRVIRGFHPYPFDWSRMNDFANTRKDRFRIPELGIELKKECVKKSDKEASERKESVGGLWPSPNTSTTTRPLRQKPKEEGAVRFSLLSKNPHRKGGKGRLLPRQPAGFRGAYTARRADRGVFCMSPCDTIGRRQGQEGSVHSPTTFLIHLFRASNRSYFWTRPLERRDGLLICPWSCRASAPATWCSVNKTTQSNHPFRYIWPGSLPSALPRGQQGKRGLSLETSDDSRRHSRCLCHLSRHPSLQQRLLGPASVRACSGDVEMTCVPLA
ncbi:hypothetical protein B0H67DRAFT_51432 [Lasiosphaeris hirsuta]|uniref:Uncharacterized protein n=1 Tax=Lasiosphaeris hirsuta TaxID=260670 RepID=A0AA40BAQ2_9PEZI|nr:hypothetical protein B0H67DRAFT_51432 [Lasiosphaeris hirsuta]